MEIKHKGKSFFKDFESAPFAPRDFIESLGRTLIVAPHADDESLGCGGLISLLTKNNLEVFILLLSDGTLSHPNSIEYPKEKLMELREEEFIHAANILNVSEKNLIFCRYGDRNVPNENSNNFENGCEEISEILDEIKPKSIFVPWRRDPHPDHRAAYQLFEKANKNSAKIYDYPIWLQELGKSEDVPNSEEVLILKLDISSVLKQKQKAILAHQSQTTDLISDDPEGFTLSQEMLEHFKVPYEIFFISK